MTTHLETQFPALKQHLLYSSLRKFFYLRLKQYNLLGRYQPDDVLAEAIIRLHSAVASGKFIFNLKSWLQRTGFNYIREISRDQKKYNSVDTSFLEYTLSAENICQIALEQEESYSTVHRVLQKLDTKDRKLLEMRFFEGLSWEEIQARLIICGESVQVGTLRKRGERALNAFRDIYLPEISS